MASSSSSNPFLFVFLSLVVCFFFENKNFVSAIRSEEGSELQQNTHHRVSLSSLIPSSSWTRPHQGKSKKGSLEVVHKEGPCSKPEIHTSPSSSFTIPHSEILKQDEARVRSIQATLSKGKNYRQEVEPSQEEISNSKELARVQLPANSGYLLGTGNYFVMVGLGSPKRNLSLEFDTGSDLTWTQCEPCSGSCYSQEEPIFDPSQSSSYSNISCSSSQCSQLVSTTGFGSSCDASMRVCMYSLLYGDGSFSNGFLAKEKLTISATDIIDDFLFGCGQNNQGHFSGIAGMLSLSRGRLSFIQQTAQKYQRIFSYCLPSFPVYVGYLNFGRRTSSYGNNVKYTPFSSIFKNSSFYGVDFIGITVADINIQVSASSGTIIDSGTVITRLPPKAYDALRDEFRRQMSMYPMVDPSGTQLDTCYNVTGYKVVNIPKISLSFASGVNVELDTIGIIYLAGEGRVCLGFAANEEDDDVAIIGNKQQKTIEVVYDVAGERIGFRPRGCQ